MKITNLTSSNNTNTKNEPKVSHKSEIKEMVSQEALKKHKFGLNSKKHMKIDMLMDLD